MQIHKVLFDISSGAQPNEIVITIYTKIDLFFGNNQCYIA